ISPFSQLLAISPPFIFNAPPPTETSTLSLHDALPISRIGGARVLDGYAGTGAVGIEALSRGAAHVTFVERDRRAQALVAENLARSEEHTSELQSLAYLVCRLLLEKKKKSNKTDI